MTQSESNALAATAERRETIWLIVVFAVIAAIVATVLIVRAVKKRRLARDYGIVAKPLTKEEIRAEQAATGKGQIAAEALTFSSVNIAATGGAGVRPGNVNPITPIATMQTHRAMKISEAAKEEKEV